MVADIVAGHIDFAGVGIGTGRIDRLAAANHNLLLVAVARLVAGRMAVVAAAALAIAVAGRAEVMRWVWVGWEAGCKARKKAAEWGRAALGVLMHQGIQAHLPGPQLPDEKICSCFDRDVVVRSNARTRDRFEDRMSRL